MVFEDGKLARIGSLEAGFPMTTPMTTNTTLLGGARIQLQYAGATSNWIVSRFITFGCNLLKKF